MKRLTSKAYGPLFGVLLLAILCAACGGSQSPSKATTQHRSTVGGMLGHTTATAGAASTGTPVPASNSPTAPQGNSVVSNHPSGNAPGNAGSGINPGANNSNNSTVTNTLPPTQVPAPPPPAPTQVPLPPAGQGLVTYQGANYSVAYPQGWRAAGGTFTDPSGLYTFTVILTYSSGPQVPGNAVLNELLAFPLGTQISGANVPASINAGGVTWSQEGEIGAATEKVVAATGGFPSINGQTIHVYIGTSAPEVTYSQVSSEYFQAMLQSFKTK